MAGSGRTRTSRRRRVAALAAVLALTLTGVVAAAMPADGPLFVPPPGNTIVSGAARLASDGHQVFVAGLTGTGPSTGSALITTATTGTLATTRRTTNGQVSAAISDGAGGWYVGGDFNSVGGARRRFLARIDADGRADPAFRPAVAGFVASLALRHGDLYVGGYFESGGRGRATLMELDAATGRRIKAFTPPVDTSVAEMAVGPDGVYASGPGSNQLLGFNPRTGAALPGFPVKVDTGITALTAVEGTVYVGGGPSHSGSVVALNARTGAREPGFVFRPRGAVTYLTMAGGRLIAAGAVGHGAVAVNPRTGAANPHFNCHFPGVVYGAAAGGTRLWLGGAINNGYPGHPRLGLAIGQVQTVSARTCAPAGPVLHPDGQVNAVAVDHGRLLTGGIFATGVYSGGQIATFDADGNLVRTVSNRVIEREQAQDAALSGAAYSDGKLWLWYPDVLIGVDPQTGHILVTRFHRAPHDPEAPTFDSITAYAGRLYALTFNGHVRAFDGNTGLPVRFRVPLRGRTATIAGGDGALYLGGSYKRTRTDGQPANTAVLRVDPASGKLDRAFDPHVNGPVQTVIPAPGRVYLLGFFFLAGNAHRHDLVAVDPQTGAVNRTFVPDVPGTGRLRSSAAQIALVGDRLLYNPQAANYGPLVTPDLAFDARTGRRVKTTVGEATVLSGAVAIRGHLIAVTYFDTFATLSAISGNTAIGRVRLGS